jgi:CRISPR/Cas system CSM-associated protein Csm2 small subunit
MDSLTKNDLERIAKAISTYDTAGKRQAVYDMATGIFNDRNSKYKDAWRDYRISTFVDRNLVKAKRLRSLDEIGELDEVLEQALDQVNENLFLAILILEQKASQS